MGRFQFWVIAGLFILTSAKGFAYYGRNSIQAILRFETTVEVPWAGKIPTLLQLQEECSPLRKQALALVDKQVLHLDGVFHTDTFADSEHWGGPASCGPWYEPNNYDLDFTAEPQPGRAPGRILLSYKFAGEVVVQKDKLKASPTHKMQVWLPVAPDQIYDHDLKAGRNMCEEVTHEGDEPRDSFYYYWDPWLPRCSLKSDNGDAMNWVTATVTRIPNSTHSSPDYRSLYQAPDKALNIAFFLGYISDGSSAKNKPHYRDDAMKAFRQIDALFGNDEVTEDLPHFHITRGGNLDPKSGDNRMRRYQRKIKTADGQDVVVKLSVLVTNTELDAKISDVDKNAKDPTFKHFLVQAIQDGADILGYDGHSGDGDYLNPEKIGLKTPVDKYAAWFINGCDGYMNYLVKFLRIRGGAKNLDLLISGTPTASDASGANDVAFLEPFLSGQTLEWQSILTRIENSNPADDGTFLMGVRERGDEFVSHPDHPKRTGLTCYGH